MRYLKKISLIFLLTYYSLGIVYFPMCDFSMIKDLPKIYQHCKLTEDANLTVVDFFTEHLIDFDKLLDEKETNHQEKPHQNQAQHISNSFVQVITAQPTTILKQFLYHRLSEKKYSKYFNNYSFIFNGEILHPPIV